MVNLAKATIDWDGYELLVKFEPFRPDIVEEIKTAIPYACRTWDAEDKCWRISTLYLHQIEEVFEVFDYAVRDYTGDEPAAKRRQAQLRTQRDERMADRKRAARLKEEARQAEEDAALAREALRKAKAEAARAKAREQAPPRQDSYQQRTQGDWSWEDEESRKRRADEAFWRPRFFTVWPSCQERHFKLWWGYFLNYGRDEANRRFSNVYAQEQQGSFGRTYRTNEEFFREFFREYRRQQQSEGQQSGQQRPRQTATATIDHYAVLGINRNTTEAEAKTAYRQLALKYHPDRNQGDAEALAMMKKVNVAKDFIWLERGWS